MMTERLSAICPAMRGAMASDLRELAKRIVKTIDEIIGEWEEGNALHHEFDDYEGDINASCHVNLSECADWRDYGDEVIAMEYYAPKVSGADVTFTFFDDGEPTGHVLNVDLNELYQLAK